MGSRDTRNNGSTYTHGRLYTRGHIRRGKLTAEQFQWGLVTTPAVIVPTIIIYCSSMAPARSQSGWEGIKSSTIPLRQYNLHPNKLQDRKYQVHGSKEFIHLSIAVVNRRSNSMFQRSWNQKDNLSER
ncbi:unnamed protein product [Lasius platythorax]|uniref:Uncharacterized protein n=1 Tax=Lasius platythorax TaxID=488582 RepID=A0AAV2NW48_9HYME